MLRLITALSLAAIAISAGWFVFRSHALPHCEVPASVQAGVRVVQKHLPCRIPGTDFKLTEEEHVVPIG